MKLHAETKPLHMPLPRGQEGATVVVEPIKVGEVQTPGAWLERTGGPFESLRMLGVGTPRSRWWWLPVQAFLVRHPTAGPFLVDTGLHGSVSAKPAANLGRGVAWAARPRLNDGEDLPSQLRARGVDARDIHLVVMTHLHLDHASGMSEFPGAMFVLSEAEFRDATTGSRPILRGYIPSHYDYAFDYRTLDYDRSNIGSYATFGRTFDLFGDGSIRLAYTPGHSAGHQCVIARLKDRDFVIGGDCVYTTRQIEDPRAPLPPEPVDEHRFRRSLQELRLFHREYPDAIITPGHDPAFYEQLGERYE